MKWRSLSVAPDATHHLLNGSAAYRQRFGCVLPFHSPGLAPVVDFKENAFHIDPSGNAAYAARFQRTFGFYQQLAAVESMENRCFHIDQTGQPVYSRVWAWCGNYQSGRCTVRDEHGQYFYINSAGDVVGGPYAYAGDFTSEGRAVVRLADGLCTHVDAECRETHGARFWHLEPYHKGIARAQDSAGWFYIDREAREAAPGERYSAAEPHYNGVAHVTRSSDGTRLLVDEEGRPVKTLPMHDEEHQGLLLRLATSCWPPLTLKLGLDGEVANKQVDLACAHLGMEGHRRELAFSEPLHSVLRYWLGVQLRPWLRGDLRTDSRDTDFFRENAAEALLIHRVLQFYGEALWQVAAPVISSRIEPGAVVVDVGGGTGDLLKALSSQGGFKQSTLVLYERPEVTALVKRDAPFQVVSGDWQEGRSLPRANVYLLSRVLHDWSDEQCRGLLAKLPQDSQIFVIDRCGNHPLLSLNMLLVNGGKERAPEDWQALFQSVGRRIESNTSLVEGYSLITLTKPSKKSG